MSAVHAIVDEILSKRQDLSEDQVLALIEEKKKEGRGLLSDEGAARLVAEELLIQTHGTELGRMQFKNLVSGLNDVSVWGRVLLAWPPQEFQRRDGTPGRVMRLILVDRSGRARCAIWDRHADTLSRAGNLQGRIVRIGHAYTRQGLAGDAEVHAGDRSSIEIDPPEMPTSDVPDFKELFTPLGKITANMNDLNTIGIVQAEPRHYSFTKEERTGSVLRTLLADETGTIPLVAWNERAEELRGLQKGDVLQVVNARTRLDTNNNRAEVHVETRGQVTILPSIPDYLKIPVRKTYKISELTSQLGAADLTVTVVAKGDPREFKRATGETVRVSRLIVADESGIASLSLWDDKAGLVNQLREGDSIELRDVVVRDRMGELSLSLGKSGELQKSSTAHAVIKPITKLNALETSKGLLIVEGVVTEEPLIRQVVTDKGETVDVASFTVRDDMGSAKVTLWREQAKDAAKLRNGTRVRVTGLRVRPGLGGQLELSSIPHTRIETIEQEISERPAWQDIRHVIALEPGLTTWIKGLVLEGVGDQRLVALCETCTSPLEVSEKSFICRNCNSAKSAKVFLEGRLRVDDGTGVIDVALSNQDPAELLSIDMQRIRDRMLAEGKPTLALNEQELSSIIGREIEVYGAAEQANTQGKFDLRARKVLVLGKQ